MDSVKHYENFSEFGARGSGNHIGCYFITTADRIFMPFVIGWIIALLANPLVQLLEKHLKIKRKTGSAFIIAVVIGGVAFLLYLAADFLAQQVIGFIEICLLCGKQSRRI